MSYNLQALPPDSGIRISDSIMMGFGCGPQIGSMNLSHGNASMRINNPGHLANLRLITTIVENGLKTELNQALSGGSTCPPILNLILGTGAGFISGGTSFFFSVVTTGIDLARRSSPVLARNGDHIWMLELVGLEGNSTKYARYYFLVDPFRSSTTEKGWLIGERRYDATFS